MDNYEKVRTADTSTKEYRAGLAAVIGCMVLWGVLPIYWKALVPINSWIIIIYRVFLVFVSALILAKTRYSFREIFGPLLSDRKLALKFFAAGAVVTVNWSTYIWAVNSGHILQASIGYYIEPLMVCIFGIIIFHERFTRYRSAAFICATIAVIILIVHFHQIPGIALGLSITFAIYSAIKKTVSQPPLISLVYETVFFAPIALVIIVYLESTGRGALGVGEPYQYFLLLLCGFATVIPLSLFASAAQKVSMFTLGLAEYISPTISMVIGILMYNEAFDTVQTIAVGIIWAGLVFFSVGEYRESR